MTVRGMVLIPLVIDGHIFTDKVFVVDDLSHNVILGKDFPKRYKSKIDLDTTPFISRMTSLSKDLPPQNLTLYRITPVLYMPFILTFFPVTLNKLFAANSTHPSPG